jgi:hypothetical protein
MSKFRKGSQVVNNGYRFPNLEKDAKGKVLEVRPDGDAIVRFEDFNSGWPHDDGDTRDNCLYIPMTLLKRHSSNMVKVNKTMLQFVIETLVDEVNNAISDGYEPEHLEGGTVNEINKAIELLKVSAFVQRDIYEGQNE